jgi:hypothetical protein
MKNFYYHIPTEVFFGKGQIENLAPKIGDYSKKVLLVYGGGSIKRTGLYEKVIEKLVSHGIAVFELGGVEPNPRIDTVRRGVKLCKSHEIGAVLSVGGGSTTDCAKLVAAGALYDGDPWELVLDNGKIKEALPIFTVVTIAATGSEMDRLAVISNMDTNEKLAVFSPYFHPKVSILDPEYTYTVPKIQTAAGTADIMSHVIERYFNPYEGAYIQNRIGDGLLKTCIHFGPIACEEPNNYDARANLLWTSTLAIDGVTWRGNEVGSSAHPMEHELSAYYDITHGIGLAILIPHWMRYILSEQTKPRFVEYAVNVWGVDSALPDDEIAKAGIERTHAFFESLGIPMRLSDLDIDETHFDEMAEKAEKRTKFSYVPLSKEDVKAIFKAAL